MTSSHRPGEFKLLYPYCYRNNIFQQIKINKTGRYKFNNRYFPMYSHLSKIQNSNSAIQNQCPSVTLVLQALAYPWGGENCLFS
jgi:hypothetical protein